MMRTSNPVWNASTVQQSYAGSDRMTVQGTVNKALIFAALVGVSAVWIWEKLYVAPTFNQWGENTQQLNPAVMPILIGALVISLIAALVTVFRPQSSAISGSVYAVAEGCLIGAISAFFESVYPGIVFQAVSLTVATLLAMLMCYKTGLIRATDKFRTGVMAATGGIALIYLVNFVMGFFGSGIPLIHGSGPFGIGFSLFVVGIAALNLVLDFDFIERYSQQGSPKYMEWYGAFGLMVTLIWLYLEILRLLAKLNNRR